MGDWDSLYFFVLFENEVHPQNYQPLQAGLSGLLKIQKCLIKSARGLAQGIF